MRTLPQGLLTCPSYVVRSSLSLSHAALRPESLQQYTAGRPRAQVAKSHEHACPTKCNSLPGGFHRSVYFSGKHQDASNGHWKDQLQTFEQYQYQSGLDQAPSDGPRLLDQPAYETNFELWLELIVFRRRQNGIESIRPLYRQIVYRNLPIPTVGETADGLWNNFLDLGLEDPKTLNDVVSYAQRLQASTGDSWPQLYSKVLKHALRHHPQSAIVWHLGLRKHFKPSATNIKDIFKTSLSSDASLRTFKRIYLDFQVRDLYSTIIPELFRAGKYHRAIQWHNLMMKENDLPPSFHITMPLFRHLARYGKTDQLLSISKHMTEAGVPALPSTEQPLESTKPLSRESLNRRLGDTFNIAPKIFTDKFCGRLVATEAIPVEALMKGFPILGVDVIGPLSLREFALRVLKSHKQSFSKSISQLLDALRDAGVSLDDSVFCLVVRNLAIQGDDLLLEEVITCDMHPDAFEDQDLQESLLAMYHTQGDDRKASRSLAILVARCEGKNLQGIRLNLLLRSAIKQQGINNVHRLLDMMQEKLVPVSAKSSHALRKGLLSPREVSKRPSSMAELPSLIAIYQQILRNDGHVDILEWREILRRLGMAGSLHELEKIALWLAEWYSNPSFRASELTMFDRKGKGEQIPKDLHTLHPWNPAHPLRILFPATAQQAIVAWGFLHTGDFGLPPIGVSTKGLTWRWGITLLRELKQRNVFITRGTVSRACRLRLIALCEVGDPSRKALFNTRRRPSRTLPADEIGEMILEIEKIWGSPIFDGSSRGLLGLKENGDVKPVGADSGL